MRHVLALLGTLAAMAAPLTAQRSDDGTTFRWEGRVGDGHAIRLHNMNGDVRLERASGSQVEVIAERRSRRGDLSIVRFDVVMRTDGDVVICALWGAEQRCTEDGPRGRSQSGAWRDDQNVEVLMRVRVPDAVRSVARSTNGSIAAEGLASAIDAKTTNGNINIRTTGGAVNAVTTNGSVTASLATMQDGEAEQSFTSTNGNVTLLAPASLSADIDMSTTNGDVQSDFPLTIVGRMRRNSVRSTIGQGGRTIVLRTTNGSVALRRSAI
jgi:hypothetical protein